MEPCHSYSSSSAPLHSILRRPIAKPMKKQHIAPLLPIPPKVYRVEARDFKEVVQKLTAAPQVIVLSSSQSPQLAAPPQSMVRPTVVAAPLPVYHHRRLHQEPLETLSSCNKTNDKTLGEKAGNPFVVDDDEVDDRDGSNLPGRGSVSPYYGWCYSLLSPGTLSALEQTRGWSATV